MRSALLLAAPLILGGCTMTTGQDSIRLPGDGTSDVPMDQAGGFGCDASAVSELIGQEPSQALGTRALELTGSRTLRWIAPGSVITMDIREDRLNIYYDAQYRIERISCG